MSSRAWSFLRLPRLQIVRLSGNNALTGSFTSDVSSSLYAVIATGSGAARIDADDAHAGASASPARRSAHPDGPAHQLPLGTLAHTSGGAQAVQACLRSRALALRTWTNMPPRARASTARSPAVTRALSRAWPGMTSAAWSSKISQSFPAARLGKTRPHGSPRCRAFLGAPVASCSWANCTGRSFRRGRTKVRECCRVTG